MIGVGINVQTFKVTVLKCGSTHTLKFGDRHFKDPGVYSESYNSTVPDY